MPEHNLKAYLETLQQNERFCDEFRLPRSETLLEKLPCSVWDPYTKVGACAGRITGNVCWAGEGSRVMLGERKRDFLTYRACCI